MKVDSSYNANLAQTTGANKGSSDKILDKIAALHTVGNESPADRILYNAQQSEMLVASQNVQNANETYSMLRVSDSALASLKEGATELNSMSVARNSAALNADQKAMIDADANALVATMQDTVEQTSYNGKSLLGDLDLSTIDLANQEGIQNLMSNLDQRLGDVGSSMNATRSELEQQSSLVSSLAYSKETKEYDVADLMSQFGANDVKLNASILAQAHSSESLAQRMGTLLG